LDRTSPAGSYAQGASSEGVLDLAGNVWEWCLNEYQKPDRTKPWVERSWVLRGGSWCDGQDCARADYPFPPIYRYYNIGFRVVVVSSPIGNAGRGAAER
jgi:formylglycine-generating enzyme required for sulfatase activity